MFPLPNIYSYIGLADIRFIAVLAQNFVYALALEVDFYFRVRQHGVNLPVAVLNVVFIPCLPRILIILPVVPFA